MKRYILLILLGLVLLGCSPSHNNGNVSSVTTPIETLALTPSETPVISQEISQACVEMDLTKESDFALRGVVVFDNLSPELVVNVFLRDLMSSNLSTLLAPGELQQFWGISPDRKYILYEYDKPSGGDSDYRLIVADSDGQIIREFDNEFPNDPYSADYYNWQNNNNIRVVLSFDSQMSSYISPRIYSPFTGDYKVLRTDFPNYVGKDLDWALDWIALGTLRLEGTNIVYDQSLTRVLYPKNDEIVSLTDANSGKELASIHLPNWGRLPKWSPDGKYLALIATSKPNSPKANDEFFVIPRDGGKFTQLTHLSNVFEQSAISNYAWSPDSKHIAFWLYSDPGDPNAEGTQSELAILDIETGEIINLCVKGISAVTHLDEFVLFSYIEPIWSPDGNQIMISQWDAQSESSKYYNVLVVDIPSLTGVKIDENKQPAGWMVKEP